MARFFKTFDGQVYTRVRASHCLSKESYEALVKAKKVDSYHADKPMSSYLASMLASEIYSTIDNYEDQIRYDQRERTDNVG